MTNRANASSFILYDKLEAEKIDIRTDQDQAIDRAKEVARESGVSVVIYAMVHIATIDPPKS